MKNREDLAKFFYQHRFGLGAEIGVNTGEYSLVLLKNNPNLFLHCVDLWERKGGKLDEAKRNLSDYSQRVNFLKGASMDIVNGFSDRSLDFVYIDAAHDFDNVMMDIIMWSKKVRRGGIVAGHDYANSRNNGVEDAVNVYAKNHQRHLIILPEPSETWRPRYPNEHGRPTGLSWYFSV